MGKNIFSNGAANEVIIEGDGKFRLKLPLIKLVVMVLQVVPKVLSLNINRGTLCQNFTFSF